MNLGEPHWVYACMYVCHFVYMYVICIYMYVGVYVGMYVCYVGVCVYVYYVSTYKDWNEG